MHRRGKVLVVALVAALSGEVGAQEEAEPSRPAVKSGVRTARPPGSSAGDKAVYQGVTPERLAGAPTRLPRRGRTPMVTWLGFQPQASGAARVFVQLDRAVPHEQELRGGELVIALTGARAASTNTVRFLDTRFFETPVERVAIERARRRPGGPRRSGGLELVIRFKDPAAAREAEVDMAAAKDGFTYLTVDVARAGERPASP